jgi:DNA protecting protein DprA
MTERDAYIALNLFDGIGPVRVRALLDALGSASAILTASVEELTEARGVGRTLAESIRSQAGETDPREELRKAKDLGAHIVSFVDDDYPAALKSIHDPPLALYVKGNLLPADQHAIGIVGSRSCTHYGTQVADRLSFQLAKQGYTVVSGLARGIDAAAHLGAIKGKGRTLAVMGTGIDQVYPPENKDLAASIIENGALLTEFPIGFKPTRQSFPQRNRIISGLAKGVLVVEAAKGSGAMQTVDEANAGTPCLRRTGPHRQSQRRRLQFPHQKRGQTCGGCGRHSRRIRVPHPAQSRRPRRPRIRKTQGAAQRQRNPYFGSPWTGGNESGRDHPRQRTRGLRRGHLPAHPGNETSGAKPSRPQNPAGDVTRT